MPAPVVVVKDVGGLVRDYQDRTELYRAQNREVRLHECRSACTLALSLPNVCVYPSSQLKFHQAYNQNTKEVDLGVTHELWSAYPPAVRARLGFLTRQYKIIRGSDLIAMGFRNCATPPDQPKILMAKAKRQEAPAAAADFLKEAQTSLAGLFGGPPAQTTDARAARPQIAARPPEPLRPPVGPPAGVAQPPSSASPPQPVTGLQTVLEPPTPPPRPPFLGVTVIPAPPAPPQTPAYLRPIPGSSPILETRFVPLKIAARKPAAP